MFKLRSRLLLKPIILLFLLFISLTIGTKKDSSNPLYVAKWSVIPRRIDDVVSLFHSIISRGIIIGDTTVPPLVPTTNTILVS